MDESRAAIGVWEMLCVLVVRLKATWRVAVMMLVARLKPAGGVGYCRSLSDGGTRPVKEMVETGETGWVRV